VAAIFIVIANSVNLLSKTEYDIAGLFNNTSNQNQNDQLIIIEYKPEEINRVEVAGLIQNLADANVRSILLDLDLSNPSLKSMDDEILANARVNKTI
jgi:CHASE2 domain-containing sensor protein